MMKNLKGMILAIALSLLLLVAGMGLVRAQETERIIHVEGPIHALQLTAEGITLEELTDEVELWVGGNAYYTNISWTENLTAEVDTESWPEGWESAKPLIQDDFDRLVIAATAGVTITGNPTYFQPLPDTPEPPQPRVIEVEGPVDELRLTAVGISQDDLSGRFEVWVEGSAQYPTYEWITETLVIDTTEWGNWDSATPLVNSGFDYLSVDESAGVLLTADPHFFEPRPTPPPPTVERVIGVEGKKDALKFTATGIDDEDLTGKFEVWVGGQATYPEYEWDAGKLTIDTTVWGNWDSATPLVESGFARLEISATAEVRGTDNPRYFAPIREDEEEPSVFMSFIPVVQHHAGPREIRVSGPLNALRLEASASIPIEDLKGEILVWANGQDHILPLNWDGRLVVVDSTTWPANEATGLWESATPLVEGGFTHLEVDPASEVYRTDNVQYMAPK